MPLKLCCGKTFISPILEWSKNTHHFINHSALYFETIWNSCYPPTEISRDFQAFATFITTSTFCLYNDIDDFNIQDISTLVEYESYAMYWIACIYDFWHEKLEFYAVLVGFIGIYLEFKSKAF